MANIVFLCTMTNILLIHTVANTVLPDTMTNVFLPHKVTNTVLPHIATNIVHDTTPFLGLLFSTHDIYGGKLVKHNAESRRICGHRPLLIETCTYCSLQLVIFNVLVQVAKLFCTYSGSKQAGVTLLLMRTL